MPLLKVNRLEMNLQLITAGRQRVISHYQHVRVWMNAFLFHLQY